MDQGGLSDPARNGSGYWSYIHIRGWNAKTKQDKSRYSKDMDELAEIFVCSKCRPDFKLFLKTNPISSYFTMVYNGIDIGMFMWSVDLHNFVNEKLRKKVYPFDLVYSNYLQLMNGICVTCLPSHSSPDVHEDIDKDKKIKTPGNGTLKVVTRRG